VFQFGGWHGAKFTLASLTYEGDNDLNARRRAVRDHNPFQIRFVVGAVCRASNAIMTHFTEHWRQYGWRQWTFS